MTDIDDVALVMLHYLTPDDANVMIMSLLTHYPLLRIVIVDNGSPASIVADLRRIVSPHKNITLIELPENLGYPRGNNAGITKLRSESYQYIVCSNCDILIESQYVLETLKEACECHAAAIVGPRIINCKGRNQNPYLYKRPLEREARRLSRKALWLPSSAYPVVWTWQRLKSYVFPKDVNVESESPEKRMTVYSLHGSFLMFGPEFFKHYNGFDPGTFLYGEERIIGEMLYRVCGKALYVPDVAVIHKEDRSSDRAWGIRSGWMKFIYRKQSMLHWYYNHYRICSPDKRPR